MQLRYLIKLNYNIYNAINLMTCASKLKIVSGIPGEPIWIPSGKYEMVWI